MALLDLVPAAAATHVATRSGSWFNPSTWGGSIPDDGARVVIPEGVTVRYDQVRAARLFTVRVDGALAFAVNRDTAMTVDTLVVAPTGSLTIGTRDEPMRPDATATIEIADNGPINVAWDPKLLSRGVISHGRITIHGAEKENFARAVSGPAAGSSAVTLSEVPSGWRVGDEIVITGGRLAKLDNNPWGGIDTAATEEEVRTIANINGRTIEFSEPLVFDHAGPRSDFTPYVANLTRNVRFRTANAGALPVSQRGHVMAMHSNAVDIRYAAFEELGRTDKSRRALDVGAFNPVRTDSNVQGRYSLHLHRVGLDRSTPPATLIGNAVVGVPGWGVVHHDSHAVVSSNVVYDIVGAGYVAEAGNETGRWADNIAIKALGMRRITKDGPDTNAFDLGRTGVGFWFQSRMVEAVDNVATDMPGGAGYIYYSRGEDPTQRRIDYRVAPQPDSLRYKTDVKIGVPAITQFVGNVAATTELGFQVIKSGPQQEHDLRSVISDFTAWEVREGVHLDYTARYTFTDIDLLASRASFVQNSSIGLNYDRNVLDIAVNRGRIDGFKTGVRMRKEIPGPNGFQPSADFWGYVFIEVDVLGAQEAFTNRRSNDLFLTQSNLAQGALRLQLDDDFPVADVIGASPRGELPIDGEKQDAVGRARLWSPFDEFILGRNAVIGAVEENGYWTLPDGRHATLVEEYFADRATGRPDKTAVYAVLTDQFGLLSNRYVDNPTDNGFLDPSSRAPVARVDRISVRAGATVSIRPLNNDEDPDGDAFTLDAVWGQRGSATREADGSITYVADGDWTGEDRFFYWIRDAHGKFARGEVIVRVD